MKPWKTLARRALVETPWLRVHEEDVRLPGGAELASYMMFEMPEWVVVVCLDETDRLVLVEQYRHGIARACLELPAGNINSGETPREAALRELREETGYTTDDWSELGVLYPEPPHSRTRATVFAARGAQPTHARALDQSEEGLRLRTVGVDEILASLGNGGIVHGVHAGALLLAACRGIVPLVRP